MMELFRENSYKLKPVDFKMKKAPSYMFDRVLITLLERAQILSHYSKILS